MRSLMDLIFFDKYFMNKNPKLYIAERLSWRTLPTLPKGYQFKNGERKNNAIVYQIWSNDPYIYYMYYSILTNVMYTDALETSDIYVFVEKRYYDEIKRMLSGILHESSIMPVDISLILKYVITTNPVLWGYENISVVDCDLFFYNDGLSTPFYKKNFEFMDREERPIAIATPDISRNTFFSRRKHLCSNISEDAYIDFIAHSIGVNSDKIEKWLDETEWPLSCFFSYKPHLFDKADYYRYTLISTTIGQLCDETVWWSYLKTTLDILPADIKTDLNNDVRIHEPFEMKMIEDKEQGKLMLVHTIVGNNRKHEGILPFFDLIDQEFRKNLDFLTVYRASKVD